MTKNLSAMGVKALSLRTQHCVHEKDCLTAYHPPACKLRCMQPLNMMHHAECPQHVLRTILLLLLEASNPRNCLLLARTFRGTSPITSKEAHKVAGCSHVCVQQVWHACWQWAVGILTRHAVQSPFVHFHRAAANTLHLLVSTLWTCLSWDNVAAGSHA